jgi:protein-tyrosine kinase
MSSIRDALRRAERERIAREQEGHRPVAAPAPGAEPPPRPPEPGAAAAPPPARELKLVESPQAPTIEVPVDFTQELALFRQGVESAVPKPRRALVLTSATSGEGVTTLCIYLATSLAVRDSKKTVLIDANFRSPKTTRVFGLLGRPGLSDYCTSRAELAEVLCRTDSPNLYVMGLGTDIYNPSLVLSHDRARNLAAELTQRFDYVLFDAGAVLGNAETSMLAATTDGVVLVVRAHKTKREVLGKAEKLIRFSGGTVIGTVLNRRKFPIPESIYKRL